MVSEFECCCFLELCTFVFSKRSSARLFYRSLSRLLVSAAEPELTVDHRQPSAVPVHGRPAAASAIAAVVVAELCRFRF